MNVYKRATHLEIVEDIIGIDPVMRFAAIIDLKGNILESIMRKGKTSLKTQKEEEHFCKQVAQRRKMRQEFNKSLGMVRYVQVEREKVTQMVIYPKRKTVYFTLEPEVSATKKMNIINKAKKITSHL
ncbi:DUF6659 family protein [Candidatus Nitrosotenuis cloacae]|uniref:Roadblock/LAMTOR2 domain-containing protein n=1 Tax=Candidatus Nitrosotenuis cloacae TaxID=1603555 RepID=A0A3G1AZU7_9ARCH|nr:DUF6659 family protein [Candidatus Nitrosotenuis cloacae]AJZ75410.1 hypothetical protein SU86_002310 [Candidatus Nitrosotenuis cloacae]